MMNLLPKILPQKPEERRVAIFNSLLRREAKIGGTLFGAVPAGHTREFFCLDEHTWVWHEQWVDESGQRQSVMTRYEFRPSGVLKAQNGSYQPLTRDEAKNLSQAIKLYYQKVSRDYQHMLQTA